MTTPIQIASTQTHRPKRAARWVLLAMLLLAGIALLAYRQFLGAPTPSNPFEPPEMTAARYAPHDMVGDLGGVPVTIPSHFANFVEYNGDPGFGEKRKGAVPQRTHQSKLMSFGYYVRFPDMEGLSAPELWKDKASYSSAKTPWILVGIKAGEIYPGDGFLDRGTHARVETPNTILKYANYEKLPTIEHGLTVYAAAGTDPKTNKPYREDTNAEDVFVHRDKAGRVDAYIYCSNRNVPAPPCSHDFSLEPHMHGQVYMSYRRSLLPQWREIQDAVKKQLLGFKAPLPETASTKP